ncbi:MAG: flotillin family protein, partial [Actinomycetota bacterium]|nr:flotillin family protein [Actinomycetota bacterium]
EAGAAATRAQAEADRDRRVLQAEAERANLEAVAAGNAFTEREIGSARAEATLAVGQAEAEAMERKAEAYKQYEDAATLELIISRLPEVARAVAEPIGKAKNITIIDTEGASKLTRVSADTMHQLDAVIESFTGSSLRALVGRIMGNGEPVVAEVRDEAEPPEA